MQNWLFQTEVKSDRGVKLVYFTKIFISIKLLICIVDQVTYTRDPPFKPGIIKYMFFPNCYKRVMPYRLPQCVTGRVTILCNFKEARVWKKNFSPKIIVCFHGKWLKKSITKHVKMLSINILCIYEKIVPCGFTAYQSSYPC
jgi:hypothetical protein